MTMKSLDYSKFCLVYFEDSWDDQRPAKHILMKIRGKTVISMVLLLKPHVYMHRCRSVTLCLKLVLLSWLHGSIIKAHFIRNSILTHISELK